jgi:hypothetical protein
MKLRLWNKAQQDANTKLGASGAAACAATTGGVAFKQLPNHVFALRAREKEFDFETDWLWSSLTQWASLGSRLAVRSDAVPEATFDMNIMVFLHNILARFDFLPQWREKKAQSSAQHRADSVASKKIDMMVTHGQHHHEVVLFESSLSVNNRRKHSREDRVKLAHATACALKTIRESSKPQAEFGVVGVHLHCMDGVYKVTASVMVINEHKFAYELHTLFDLPVPLALGTKNDLVLAVDMLVHFNALARFVQAQLEVAGSSKVGADESKGGADDTGREDARGGVDQGDGGGFGSPSGKAPPTNQFKPTPGSKKPSGSNSRKATLSQVVAPTIHVLFEPPTVGGHARVFRGVVRSDHHTFGDMGAEVALKVSCERDYCLREVRALHRLTGVPGVVPLLDLCDCDRGLVLVLPWLQPAALSAPATQPRKHEQLVLQLLHIVAAMHARGVAHCDLKPDAVMRTSAGDLVVVDFNLARDVDEPLDGDLPGTAGWVFNGSPATTGAAVDRVALAAIIGWLLRVSGCGDSSTTFEEAVGVISSARNTASGCRRRLLQAAASLLSSACAIVDIAARLVLPAARAVQGKENSRLSQLGDTKSTTNPHSKEQTLAARAPLAILPSH